jgi:hypothetical protein
MRSSAKAAQSPFIKQAIPCLVQRQYSCGQHAVNGECNEWGKKKGLFKRASPGPAPNTILPIVHDVLESPWQSLDPTTRTLMEPRFGHDFSKIRIHTDTSVARQLNAAAFTIGTDIIFSPGAYVPSTLRGRRLIAHELVHAVQYMRNPVEAETPITSRAENAVERQADRVGHKLALGLPIAEWTPEVPSSILSLALETWFRGEVEGLSSAKDVGVIHDLGDGVYFSDRFEVAKEYSHMRPAQSPTARRVLMGQIDPNALGKVLDLTKESEFMRDFNLVKKGLNKVSGEPYRGLVEGFLKQKGLKLEDFDVIIGPEGVRGGKQMCIRNPKIAVQVKTSLMPAKIPSGGRGSGSTGGESQAPKPEAKTITSVPKQVPKTVPPVEVSRPPAIARSAIKSAIKLVIVEISLNVLFFVVTYYLEKWFDEKQLLKLNNDLKRILPAINTQLKSKKAEIMEKANAFPLVYGNITVIYTKSAIDNRIYNEGSMKIQKVGISHQNYQAPEKEERKLRRLTDLDPFYSLTFSVPLFEEEAAEKGTSSLVRNYRRVREFLRDTAYKVRLQSAITLHKLAKQDQSLVKLVVRDLLGLLKDENALVRLVAAKNLSNLKAKIAIQYIREVIATTNNDKEKEMIRRYLRELERG